MTTSRSGRTYQEEQGKEKTTVVAAAEGVAPATLLLLLPRRARHRNRNRPTSMVGKKQAERTAVPPVAEEQQLG